jgi:hypothetical protein
VIAVAQRSKLLKAVLDIGCQLPNRGERKRSAENNAHTHRSKDAMDMNANTSLQIMMLLIWLMFVYRMFRSFPKSFASRHWVRVAGRVTANEECERSYVYGMAIYKPIVSYRYNVNGTEYHSKLLTYLGTSGGFGGGGFGGQASERLRALAPNGTVDVFVNPQNPAEAVLIPGVHWAQYVLFIGLTAFCMGVAFIVPILNFIWPGCQPNCH